MEIVRPVCYSHFLIGNYELERFSSDIMEIQTAR